MRKAGSSFLSDPDFLETDFKYFQTKTEFYEPSILSFLEDQDKVMMENGRWSEETYLLTLFPTFTNTRSGEDRVTYFSTFINSKGTEILCVIIPENISEVKMYEEKGSSSEDRKSGTESILVTFSETEREFSKVFWMITSYIEGSPKVLDLSWIAYHGDKNPNAKMSDYVLRNDSLVHDYRGTTINNEYLYSNISGSLIGTERLSISKSPIYYKKRLLANETIYWSSRKRYSIGDRVKVGKNMYYTSLENNNIGNHPYYSRMWVNN